MASYDEQALSVMELAKFCSERGWLPATSGNLSVLVTDEPLRIAITRSGADKQQLRRTDVLLIDENMASAFDSPYRPSAETSVHIELYRKFHCRCIVHVHTVFNNLVSEIWGPAGEVRIANHELLKAFGHFEENAVIHVPIVPNHSDLTRLGQAVSDVAVMEVPVVFVRQHGVYAWGETVDAARRHLEAIEFLSEYLYRMQVLNLSR